MTPADNGPSRRLVAVGSVWATGQQQAASQRRGRYTPASISHPGKMLPSIAREVITRFTRPGETALDPLCGIGTTLVEAAHLGRDALGIELEPHWASLARANLALAAGQGATGQGRVHTGDALEVARGLATTAAPPQARLLLTSPPYGSMTHGQIVSRRDGEPKINKTHHRYAPRTDTGNLAYRTDLLQHFTTILTACRALLAPGALVAITTRPYRKHGALIDFPGRVEAAARAAGLLSEGRAAALLCALRDGGLVSRVSFFQTIETRRLRTYGRPVKVIQHEDVLLLRNPAPPG